ncbi:hypothetical protein [Methylocystis bryophila]|uniref:hypothetical protein n=1 Tax=Methylocystis bryophila TaxID=655015 RepID=UPI00131A3822|nr:hypothetical protein [Methylocystis bryophila]BDV39804.1 hypothetical protein DSM21852_30570 [Methylocystis bryophila]
MMSEAECAQYVGIALAELPSPTVFCSKHRSLLESYRLNLKWGERTVCKMILSDFWSFMELGAKSRAADQFLVLRLFLSGCVSRERLR